MSKSVLITGANRGLGKHLSTMFAKNNYNLIEHCGRISGDLRDPNTIRKLKDLASVNDIDVLIHNAAIYQNKFFPDITIDEFADTINTNLISPIALTKAIWPIFQKKKSGVVVFINSVAGKCGSPGELAYCTSKFGLTGFAECLQFDGVRANVKVISVFLGAMLTDMTKKRGGPPEAYIDPEIAAQLIFDACKQYKGAEITELTIDRVGKKDD